MHDARGDKYRKQARLRAHTTTPAPSRTTPRFWDAGSLVKAGLGRILDVKVLDEVRHVVVVVVFRRRAAPWPSTLALDRLIRLGELAQRRERVGAKLVEDARHELGKLLDVPGAVDGECVGGEGGVHCELGAASAKVESLCRYRSNDKNKTSIATDLSVR